VLVPWRYEVRAETATNCFKPNPLPGNFDHESHKTATLGAVFMGALNRVPRQSTSPHASLVWEVGLELFGTGMVQVHY